MGENLGFVRRAAINGTSSRDVRALQNRPAFDSWDRECSAITAITASGADGDGYVLACPPDIEVSIYENSTAVESNIWPEIVTIQIPVHVVRVGLFRSRPVYADSLTPPDLAASFTRGNGYTASPEHSHFIPMESPELAAKLIADAIGLL